MKWKLVNILIKLYIIIYCIVVIWISMNSFVLFRFADLQGWNVTDLLVADWWNKIFKCANQTQLALLRISKILIHVKWRVKNKDAVPAMPSHLLICLVRRLKAKYVVAHSTICHICLDTKTRRPKRILLIPSLKIALEKTISHQRWNVTWLSMSIQQ